MATPIVDSVDEEEVAYAKSSWWCLLLKRKLTLKSRTPMQKDGEGEGVDQKEPPRGFWANEVESVLSLLGLAVGLGNVWRFPWMVSRNGGGAIDFFGNYFIYMATFVGAFLIPYFFMLFFCGLPLFLMELTIGQYSGSGPGNVFEAAPLFRGLGWCVLAGAILGATYYITIISWAIYYMFSSFQKYLPWIGCKHEWNSPYCYSKDEEEMCTANNTLYLKHMCKDNATEHFKQYLDTLNSTRISSTDEFFNRKMYNIYFDKNSISPRPMENSGLPKWDLTLTLLFTWLITYLCICKGIKSSGKVVYFTALFPYLAITGLLIVAAQLDGAGDGVKYYLQPPANASVLANHHVWVDATTQIFYSLGLSGGSVMTYASYNKYNNNILRDCLIVGIGNSLTSFYAGFPVFCILGYMAKRLNTDIKSVVKSGSALVFIVYPEVLNKLPGAQFWCFLFFLMLVSLGLDSQFGTIETLLTAILDKKPKLLPKKPLIALVICSTICVFGLSTVVQAGVYWEEMLNYYAGFATVVLALINATVYGWIYGAGNLLDHLQHMINIKFPVTLVWILLFLWKILAPLIISVILIFNFIAVSKIDYHGYVLPDWAQLFGWLTVWVPFLMVPIAAVLEYRKEVAANPYEVLTVWQRIVKLTKPSSKWIPSYLKHEQDIINPPTENGVDNADTIINSSTSYGTNRNSIDMTDITLQNSNLPV